METPSPEYKKQCEELHQKALAKGKDFYTDPATGYLVSTKKRLLDRKKCCETGCRHCPYGFVKAPQQT